MQQEVAGVVHTAAENLSAPTGAKAWIAVAADATQRHQSIDDVGVANGCHRI